MMSISSLFLVPAVMNCSQSSIWKEKNYTLPRNPEEQSTSQVADKAISTGCGAFLSRAHKYPDGGPAQNQESGQKVTG